MKSPENSSSSKEPLCDTCKGRKKLLKYKDGTVGIYMPAMASDSHHRGTIVVKCHDCEFEN
jgi:hypothetical protein